MFMAQGWYTQAHPWSILAGALFALSVFAVLQVLNRFRGRRRNKTTTPSDFHLSGNSVPLHRPHNRAR